MDFLNFGLRLPLREACRAVLVGLVGDSGVKARDVGAESKRCARPKSTILRGVSVCSIMISRRCWIVLL